MTVPAPVSRPPAGHGARSHRPAADVAAGLAAILALAVLILGVPAALLTVVGPPIPHPLPGLSALTRQLTVTAILPVLSVVVWLAWLQLVACVIAEIRAAVRNSGMPARVPLAGGIQALAHTLVTAALLLASATTSLSPAPAFALAALPSAAQPVPAGAGPAATPAVRGGSGAGRSAMGAGGGAGVPAVGGSHGAGGAHGAGRVHMAGGGRGVVQAGRERPVTGLEKVYVVQPPAGRHHQSLWEIAEDHLGSGRRYREIYELNRGRPQPDGSELTIASLIRPGWVLRMPGDAYGPGIEEAPAGHAGAAGTGGTGAGTDGTGTGAAGTGGTGAGTGGTGAGTGGTGAGTARAPAAPAAGEHPAGVGTAGVGTAGVGTAGVGTGGVGAGGVGAGGRERATPGASGGTVPPGAGNARELPPAVPAAAPPAVPAAAPPAVPAAPPSPEPAAAPPALPGTGPYPAELAAASLLAAGLLSALGRRRRLQRWARAPGRRVAGPVGEAAAAEAALRLSASQPQARMLDTGLRHLSQALAGLGRPLPTVFAAHIGSGDLNLWIAPADLRAPAPWAAVGDGRVWRLAAAPAARLAPPASSRAEAPYPGLVSIGADGTGRVLVDLGSAHGLIALTGPGQLVSAALAAMAAELATSIWSGETRVTMVGFGSDMTVLAPGRLTYVPTLAEALPVLAARTAAAEEAVAATGMVPVTAGHSRGERPGSWAPHYLISAVPPTSAERDRLLALAHRGHGAATGFVVAGEVEGATWTWELTPEGRLGTGPLGLDVQAQLLPPAQRRSVVELFTVAADEGGEELPALLPDILPAGQADLDAVMPVEVTLLGPASVRAPGPIEPDGSALATELIVYLATHPAGVHPNVLSAALWPRGVSADVREGALTRVREWLGTDGIGRPHLAADVGGRLRLGSQVRVDWDVFRALAAQAAQAARGPGGAPEEERCLARALGLVAGPFLDGRQPGRYAWLAVDGLEGEVGARVADAAHRLAELRLRRADAAGAMDAAHAGLRLAREDELLWRDLLRAAASADDPALLHGVAAQIHARAARDPVGRGVAPQTQALIAELLPAWRPPVP